MAHASKKKASDMIKCNAVSEEDQKDLTMSGQKDGGRTSVR